MKKKKYLPLYYKWMEGGKMDFRYGNGVTGGLCGSSASGRLLNLFEPPAEIYNHWWGYESDFGLDKLYEIQTAFTPMRQTVLLFMAAINDEL